MTKEQFEALKARLEGLISAIAQRLGAAQALLQRLQTGYQEQLAQNLSDQLVAIAEMAESLQEGLRVLRDEGYLSAADMRTAMEKASAARIAILDISVEAAKLRQYAQMGLLSRTVLSLMTRISDAIRDFAAMSGILAALRHLERIAASGFDALRLLPYVGLAVGALLVYQWFRPK